MSKKKILTILGTRPEIIRLSEISTLLDKYSDHKILHTGQNYDPKLNDIFYNDLELRKPDIILDVKGKTLSSQLGTMMNGTESLINEFKPDGVVILGDTNSGIMAIVSERMGVPVYHLEAGNRCYDMKVPEEKNRRIIDHISTHNLPYTPGSRENLLSEGINKTKIFECGNPIKEVIKKYESRIEDSLIRQKFNINKNGYVLVTAHRAENVDNPERLNNIFTALKEIANTYTVIFSCHPRTQNNIYKFNIDIQHKNLKICEPFGFFDFLKLEADARIVITDSGTCQEEACLFGVPTVTIRETTERPETIKCGSNIVSGLDTNSILSCYKIMIDRRTNWKIPEGYDVDNVSENVVQYILGAN